MGELTIKEKNNRIIYKICRPEVVMPEVCSFINGRCGQMFFRVENEEKKKGKATLTVETAGFYTLEKFLQNETQEEVFFRLVNQILDCMTFCECNQLNTCNLELQTKTIFVSQAGTDIKMIYWPVINREGVGSVRNFFRAMFREARIPGIEQCKRFQNSFRYAEDAERAFSIHIFRKICNETEEKTSSAAEVRGESQPGVSPGSRFYDPFENVMSPERQGMPGYGMQTPPGAWQTSARQMPPGAWQASGDQAPSGAWQVSGAQTPPGAWQTSGGQIPLGTGAAPENGGFSDTGGFTQRRVLPDTGVITEQRPPQGSGMTGQQRIPQGTAGWFQPGMETTVEQRTTQGTGTTAERRALQGTGTTAERRAPQSTGTTAERRALQGTGTTAERRTPQAAGVRPVNIPQESVFLVLDDGTKMEAPKIPCIVGKGYRSADLVIEGNITISRAHCSLTGENGQYFITDLNSRNGTWLNGRRLECEKKYVINSGDQIKLSNEKMTFLVSRKGG